MPQDQSQLRNLLALLAQFKQSGLARVFIQKIGNILQSAPVIFRHRGLKRCLLGMGLSQGIDTIVGAGNAVVVLLLGNVGSSSGGGGLGMLAELVMGCLLVQPGRVGLGVLVVSVDVRVRHHLCGKTIVGNRRGCC